jgi:hypothetical protein
MPMSDRSRPRLVALALMAVTIVPTGLALSACGSSSNAASGSTTPSASTGAGGGGGAGGRGGFLRNLTPAKRAALVACLRQQGVTLPNRPAGGAGGATGPTGPGRGGPGRGGGFLFGGGQRRSGSASNFAQTRAALAKCGVTLPARTGGAGLANNAALRTQLTNFAVCVRKNGYNLPAPNFSGSGPVFNPAQVNRNDPKFVAAAKKCSSLLPARFGGSAPGGPGAGG